MAYSALMHACVQVQACVSKKVNNSLLLEVTKTSTPGGDDPGVCVCVCVCFCLFVRLQSRSIYIGNLLAMEEVQMIIGWPDIERGSWANNRRVHSTCMVDQLMSRNYY